MRDLSVMPLNWPRSVRYALAVGLFLSGLILRFAIAPHDSGMAFTPFYPVVLLSFFLLGSGAGALTATLSGLAAEYFFVPPYNSFAFDPAHYGTVLLFALTSALMGWVISRLHRTARSLYASEQDIHAILENLPLMVFVKDAKDLRFVRFNQAGESLLGIRREQMLGKSDYDFFPPEQAAFFIAKDRETLRRGETVDIPEEAIKTKHGPRWLHTRKVAVRADDDTPRYLLGISEDISERKRAEEEIRRLNADLERRVAERTEQVRRLASELEAAEIRERRQIAQDLHDDLGQTLAVIRIRLSGLCESENEDVRAIAKQVSELVAQADRSTRSLAAQLTPPVLYELGLVAATEWLSEEIEGSFGISVLIEDDGEPKPLSQGARSLIYRAVRELLINVAKHAQADTATVRLTRSDGSLIVAVCDNGVGFDPAAVAAKSNGFGLASIRERMTFIGGSLEVRGAGAGTEAILTVPLSDDNGRPGTPA